MRNFRTLLVGASAAALLATTAGPALALPPGGANTVDTPGTAVTLTTNEIPANDCVVHFTVTGWAPNAEISGKIDDGIHPGVDKNQQFTGVDFKGVADDKGVVTGSMECDKYNYAPGTKHWLRFLTNVKDADGKSHKYSLRGNSDFTIVEPKKTEPTTTPDHNGTTKPDNDKGKTDGSGGGGIAIIVAIVLAILGAAGAALSGAIPGLPRP